MGECSHLRTKVISNQRQKGGNWLRVRICTGCAKRFDTIEVRAEDHWAEIDRLRSLAVKWNLHLAGHDIK